MFTRSKAASIDLLSARSPREKEINRWWRCGGGGGALLIVDMCFSCAQFGNQRDVHSISFQDFTVNQYGHKQFAVEVYGGNVKTVDMTAFHPSDGLIFDNVLEYTVRCSIRIAYKLCNQHSRPASYSRAWCIHIMQYATMV